MDCHSLKIKMIAKNENSSSNIMNGWVNATEHSLRLATVVLMLKFGALDLEIERACIDFAYRYARLKARPGYS